MNLTNTIWPRLFRAFSASGLPKLCVEEWRRSLSIWPTLHATELGSEFLGVILDWVGTDFYGFFPIICKVFGRSGFQALTGIVFQEVLQRPTKNCLTVTGGLETLERPRLEDDASWCSTCFNLLCSGVATTQSLPSHDTSAQEAGVQQITMPSSVYCWDVSAAVPQGSSWRRLQFFGDVQLAAASAVEIPIWTTKKTLVV